MPEETNSGTSGSTSGTRKSFLKSKKFWMAVVSSVLIMVNSHLPHPLPADQVATIAGIVVAYILGEAYIDAKK